VSTDPVRALVVDAAGAERDLLARVLSDGGVEVVGLADDGERAVSLVTSLRPSVVVMDTSIGGMGAYDATRQIMAATPTPIVLVTGEPGPEGVEASLRATSVGALTVQRRPTSRSPRDFDAQAARLVTIVRAMADVKVVGRRRRPRVRSGGSGAVQRRRRVEVIGIGASTGGPPAVHRFLGLLPRTLAAPVLIVQHIPDGFIDGFVRWLVTGSELPVKVAEQGEVLVDGTAYVAPHGVHLEIDPERVVQLMDGPPVSGFRPSVSVLFSTLARSFGAGAAGVVLTGMGEDGLEGARELVAAGGVVLAQDELSSAVFGMPRAVAAAGLAQVVGPVDQLALRISQLVPMEGDEIR
jgi:two-component system chemotaxis response regulator CheB